MAELTRRNLEKRPPALEPTQKSMEAVGERATTPRKRSPGARR